jgi:hypothetical protein
MARELFTLEWAEAWRDQIRANAAYQAAARIETSYPGELAAAGLE